MTSISRGPSNRVHFSLLTQRNYLQEGKGKFKS